MKSTIALKTKIGIVTTVADAEEHIEFFLNYHRSIGIFHVFVFIDDQCEKTYEKVKKYAFATPVYVNEDLQDKWRMLACFRNTEKRSLIHKEVMVRQEYNTYIGYVKAKELGIDWLLHIDIDELFYPNGVSLDEHYNERVKKNIGGCIYTNYEAIPVKQESECIYTSTPYFKKNFFKKGHWFFSDTQRKLIDESEWLSKYYFNYYQNGKSGAYIHNDLIVEDVHSMWGDGKEVEFLGHQDPIILHFPSVTIKEFSKKYKRLGDFDNLWRGFPRAGKFIDSFHLDARDAFKETSDTEFKNLFFSRMMDDDKIQKLIENDLVVKIDILKPIHELDESLIDNQNNYKKKNILHGKKSGFLDLINTQLNNDWKISFNSLGEARIWLRRHPVLSKKPGCIISQELPHTITCNEYPLYDFYKIALDFDNKKSIFINPESEKDAYLVALDEQFCFKSINTLTELDIFLKKLEFLKAKYSSEISSQAIFFEIPMHRLLHLLEFPAFNIIDYELISVVCNAVKEKKPSTLVLYLMRNYPKSKQINCAISTVHPINFSPLQEEVISSIAYGLGGTIILDKNNSNSISKFAQLRDQYAFLIDDYAEVHEHKNLIILRKSKGLENFIAICNLSNEKAECDLNDFLDARKNYKCIDLIKNESLSRASVIKLDTFEYRWLLATNFE